MSAHVKSQIKDLPFNQVVKDNPSGLFLSVLDLVKPGALTLRGFWLDPVLS